MAHDVNDHDVLELEGVGKGRGADSIALLHLAGWTADVDQFKHQICGGTRASNAEFGLRRASHALFAGVAVTQARDRRRRQEAHQPPAWLRRP